jgi:hypothetical protein
VVRIKFFGYSRFDIRSFAAGYTDVLGGYAAENRGADFVQHLVLSPCARTRHWTRLRFSEPHNTTGEK